MLKEPLRNKQKRKRTITTLLAFGYKTQEGTQRFLFGLDFSLIIIHYN
jgi:hypothetical protein